MDTEEFKLLLGQAYGRMTGTAMSLLGNADDARDAVQETAAALWRNSEALAASCNPAAYCVASVRNRCVSILRLKKRETLLDEAMSLSGGDGYDDSTPYLSELMRSLPARQRKVLEMKICGDMENSEIALCLGLSEGNVRQLLSRGRKVLRQLYLKDRI